MLEEKNSILDENVFLITGEFKSFSSQKMYAMAYVIAENAQQAIEEQLKIQPNLLVSGVVNLADLKIQIEKLEAAKSESIAVLKCGKFNHK